MIDMIPCHITLSSRVPQHLLNLNKMSLFNTPKSPTLVNKQYNACKKSDQRSSDALKVAAGPMKDLRHLSPEEDEEACIYAARLARGSALPMTLKAAVELDLLEIIVQAGPGNMLSAAEIADKLPTTNPEAAEMVDRILRLLAAYSIVSCVVETGGGGRTVRKYGAEAVCKYLTRNEDGASYAHSTLMHQDRVFIDSWALQTRNNQA